MHYPYTITIPSGTTRDDPARLEIALTYGIIIQVGYFFIPDCAGYVGARVKHREHVVWPTNPDTWYVRNEGGESWEEDFDLTVAPHTLVLEGYNEDDSYEHEVEFSFTVKAPEGILSRVFQRLLTPPAKRTVKL